MKRVHKRVDCLRFLSVLSSNDWDNLLLAVDNHVLLSLLLCPSIPIIRLSIMINMMLRLLKASMSSVLIEDGRPILSLDDQLLFEFSQRLTKTPAAVLQNHDLTIC